MSYSIRMSSPPADEQEPEYKAFPLLGFKAADEPAGTFSGYASTWTKDSYGDVIQPGAFAQSITDQRGKIPILFNHDPDKPVGFATSLAEDHKGLMLTAALALDTAGGSDAYALLKAADAADYRMGLSIGFIAEEWEYDDSSHSRIIKVIDLWETSLTLFPANKRAFVDSVKSLHNRNFEKRLRDVGGFSTAQCKRIVSLLNAPLASGLPDAHPPMPSRDVGAPGTLNGPPQADMREKIWLHLQRR